MNTEKKLHKLQVLDTLFNMKDEEDIEMMQLKYNEYNGCTKCFYFEKNCGNFVIAEKNIILLKKLGLYFCMKWKNKRGRKNG